MRLAYLSTEILSIFFFFEAANKKKTSFFGILAHLMTCIFVFVLKLNQTPRFYSTSVCLPAYMEKFPNEWKIHRAIGKYLSTLLIYVTMAGGCHSRRQVFVFVISQNIIDLLSNRSSSSLTKQKYVKLNLTVCVFVCMVIVIPIFLSTTILLMLTDIFDHIIY